MNVFKNVDISPYSYIKVGGVVDKLYIVKNEENFIQVLNYENNVKLIGQASKILFAFDYDYSSYILDRNDYIKEEKDRIIIGSGTPLNKIGDYFEKRGYEGFSFIRTIPGRLGGSLVQNASCFNECVSDKLIRVKVYFNHRITYKNKEDLAFSYRNSIFKKRGYIILGVMALISKDKKEKIKERMREFVLLRTAKQPQLPSAGSVFKNGESFYAGKLIEEMGLKGKRVGGAMVSEKHANFIVNYKNASGKDVVKLIKEIKKMAKIKFNATLCEEVVIQ